MNYFVQVGDVEFAYTVSKIDNKLTMIAETDQQDLVELAATALNFKAWQLKAPEKTEEIPAVSNE